MLLTLLYFCLFFVFSNSSLGQFRRFHRNDRLTMANRRLSATQSADQSFWSEQFHQIELARNGDPAETKELISQLRNKQRLMETIFGGTEPNVSLDDQSTSSEYECMKKRWHLLMDKDPALSQVLNHLFLSSKSAKQKLQSLAVKTMRQRLAFVLSFLAKRHQIQLTKSHEHFELTRQSPTNFLKDLFKFVDNAKRFANCEKCANGRANESGRGGGQNNKSSRKQLFQFISKSIQIDWQSNGLSDRSKNENRRRKRRRKALFEPINIALLVFFLVIIVTISVLLCQDAIISIRNSTSTFFDVESTAANATAIELTQMNGKWLDAFKRIPSVVVVESQKGNEGKAEKEQLDCAVCLGTIELGTKVRPLPVCKHIFHDECIELWIQGGHNACPLCRQEIFKMQMHSTKTQTRAENGQNNRNSRNDEIVIEINGEGRTIGANAETHRTTAENGRREKKSVTEIKQIKAQKND